MKAIAVITFVGFMIIMTGMAYGVKDDKILSQDIKEADGTTGQNTNVGSGIKTGHIQDGAVTDAKITGPINASKIGPGFQKKYAKVAVVAQSGGDYTDPRIAMDNVSTWCGGAPSETNPCLLKIMPGVYDIGVFSLQMSSFVDIEGSGENTTKIIGGYPAIASGTVKGADNAEIRFLTIENTNAGTSRTAVYNYEASPTMTNITVTASGGQGNYGIWNKHYSAPTMTNVTAIASGGTGSTAINSAVVNEDNSSPSMMNVTATASGTAGNYYGIFNQFSSSPTMTNIKANASGGATNAGTWNHSNSSPMMMNIIATASSGGGNYGISNTVNSSPTMKNLTATATGGTNNWGVSNGTDCFPTMMNATVTASGGSNLNYGVHAGTVGPGTIRIDHSVITGDTNAIIVGEGFSIYVGNTKLDGGVQLVSTGTINCVGVYDESYHAYTCP